MGWRGLWVGRMMRGHEVLARGPGIFLALASSRPARLAPRRGGCHQAGGGRKNNLTGLGTAATVRNRPVEQVRYTCRYTESPPHAPIFANVCSPLIHKPG